MKPGRPGVHASRVSETSRGVWSGVPAHRADRSNGCDIRRYWRGVRYFDGVVEVSQLLS